MDAEIAALPTVALAGKVRATAWLR
jgi:hypothetical protein